MRVRAGVVVRWPLWSWRNLSLTVAAVLLVLFGVGRVVEPAKITLATTQATQATQTVGTPLDVASPGASQPPGPAPVASSPAPAKVAPPGAVASQSVTRVAAAFAAAWSYSGRSQQEWTRGIRAFVTPALAAGLAQTDPGRVPATKVTGEAALVAVSATSAMVKVPTDGGSIVVTLVRAATGRWLVSDVAPADQPPGAPTPDLRPSRPGGAG